MLKRIAALFVIVLSLSLSVSLTSCTPVSATTGLNRYSDSTDGYQFLYPNGWVEAKVKGGPDVVFRDLIQDTENVSVVISDVADGKTLEELGTPGEVGYQLSKNAIAPEGSGRVAELVDAQTTESNGKTYYILEYQVQLPNRKRHNLTSVVVSRGKLITFNLSTSEQRWNKLKPLFKQVVSSFSAY